MKELNNRIDVFLLPSDQVLGPLFLLNYDKYTLLDWVRDDKPKIAYASSFGTEYFDGNENLRAEMEFYLNRFDSISVRESSGIKYAKYNFNIDVEQVLDPIFLSDPNLFIEMANNSDQKILQSSFLGVYVLKPTNQMSNLIKSLIYTLQLKKYFIIINPSITNKSARSLWDIDFLENANVSDFLSCINNCDYFLTDSYHGICFSIIFKKQFIALYDKDQEKASERIYDLLKKLNLEKRLFSKSYNIIDNVKLLDKINYDDVYKVINTEIIRSKTYLTKMFESISNYKKNRSVYDIIDDKIDNIYKEYFLIKKISFVWLISYLNKLFHLLKKRGFLFTLIVVSKKIKKYFIKG